MRNGSCLCGGCQRTFPQVDVDVRGVCRLVCHVNMHISWHVCMPLPPARTAASCGRQLRWQVAQLLPVCCFFSSFAAFQHFRNNGYMTLGVGKLFHDGGGSCTFPSPNCTFDTACGLHQMLSLNLGASCAGVYMMVHDAGSATCSVKFASFQPPLLIYVCAKGGPGTPPNADVFSWTNNTVQYPDFGAIGLPKFENSYAQNHAYICPAGQGCVECLHVCVWQG